MERGQQKNELSNEEIRKHKGMDENIFQHIEGETYTKTPGQDPRENMPKAKKEIVKDKNNKNNDDFSEENKEAKTKSGESYDEDNKVD